MHNFVFMRLGDLTGESSKGRMFLLVVQQKLMENGHMFLYRVTSQNP